MRKWRHKNRIHRVLSHIKKRLTNRGFTLIEMLVVISILAILTALTLSSINVKNNFDQARDTERKSDVNQIQKALVQYYIDHRCYPTLQQWDQLVCHGEIPDEFKPYFTAVPCDPETGEKYFYEPLDKSCKRCNEGCGVCAGLRILTHLVHDKNHGGGFNAGCDEVRGCGVKDSQGNVYNYGIGTTNQCVVPTPTGAPDVPTSTIIPSSTIVPVPTIVHPTHTPTPIATHIGRLCVGQLLQNASFEVDTNGDHLPDKWDPVISPLVVVREGEAVVCGDSSDGTCAYKFLPWISPWSPVKVPSLSQTLNIAGDAGTAFTFSGDVKSALSAGSTGTVSIILTMYYTDYTRKSIYLDIRDAVNYEWTYGVSTVYAEKPFNKIKIDASIGPSNNSYTLDNVCLTKTINPIPTPLPEKAECSGQLLNNGSFEIPAEVGGYYPKFWNQITSSYIHHMYPEEGRNCATATQGSCAYKIFPFYYPTATDVHQFTLQQSVLQAGNPGDVVTLSLDGKLEAPVQNNPPQLYYNLIEFQLFPSDGQPGSDKTTYSLTNWKTNSWEKKTISLTATRPFYGMYLNIWQPTYPQKMYIDNVCLKKSP